MKNENQILADYTAAKSDEHKFLNLHVKINKLTNQRDILLAACRSVKQWQKQGDVFPQLVLDNAINYVEGSEQ